MILSLNDLDNCIIPPSHSLSLSLFLSLSFFLSLSLSLSDMCAHSHIYVCIYKMQGKFYWHI